MSERNFDPDTPKKFASQSPMNPRYEIAMPLPITSGHGEANSKPAAPATELIEFGGVH